MPPSKGNSTRGLELIRESPGPPELDFGRLLLLRSERTGDVR